MRKEVDVILLLIACSTQLSDAESAAQLDGQSGNEGGLFPPVCTVTERIELGDDDVAHDFTIAPSAITIASEGLWTGWYDVDETDANTLAEARFEIRFSDAVPELVTSRLVGTIEGPDGEHIDIDEISPDCPPRYELRATGLFSGNDGALDESIVLTVSATAAFAVDAQSLVIFGALGLAAIQGTASPSWDPTDWTTTSLELHSTLDEEGTMYGTTSWVSLGPDGSGEVQRENYGGFSLTRQP